MKRTLEAICTGTTRPFNGAELSAFVKRPREGVVQFLEDGLAPDEQADRRNHGGPDMAVHLYPLVHHEFWRERLGAIDLLDEPGAFGSNLAVNDLTESQVHIGDRFRLGSALLEVSQPRKPCWKIEHRFSKHCNSKGMVATIVKTARCGWYFRVLEIGEAEAGDVLERVEIATRPGLSHVRHLPSTPEGAAKRTTPSSQLWRACHPKSVHEPQQNWRKKALHS